MCSLNYVINFLEKYKNNYVCMYFRLSKMYEDAVLMIEKYPLIWTYIAELTG